MKIALLHAAPMALAMWFAISADPAFAQDQDFSEATDNSAPSGDLARPPAWQVAITAGTEEKTAKLSLDLLRLNTVLSGNDTSAYASDHALNVSVSTPWDKKTDALPASLDGLANGTKFSLDYSFFGSRRFPDISDAQEGLWQKAMALCLADKGRTIGATPSNFESKCSDENDSSLLVQGYLSDRDQRRYATGSFDGGLHAFGVTASVGFNDFKFADPVQLATGTIATLKDRETSWSAGLRYSYYLAGTPTAIGLGVDYESAWKAADSVTLCPPPAGPAVVQCTSIAPLAPTRTDSTKLSANIRHRFLFGDTLSNFAISPRFTYAIVEGKEDVWGVEFPVYFIPNGKGGLNGGVKAGYRSDSDDVTFGIFLGAAFGLVQ